MASTTLRWVRRAIAVLAVASVVASWLWLRERAGAAAETAVFSYPTTAAARCPEREATSPVALRTAGGVAVTVRTPRNYDPRYAHGLLVVFAPAGFDRAASERFTGLTAIATAAGFIVAYVDHRTLSPRVIADLGSVAALVGEHWCIDGHRVFLTGHSDGGTAAVALALSTPPGTRFAGIAPSAAGFTAADLRAYQCPAPLAILVAHGAADTLFPDYGRQAVAWWAACNKCAVAPPDRGTDDCLTYRACAAPTVYCEHAGGHTVWPDWNLRLIERLANSAATS